MSSITVGGWFLFIFFALILAFIGFAVYVNCNFGALGAVITTIVTMFFIALVLVGISWYYTNTASGQRAVKSQESNFNMGIRRSVKVYDMNGGLIQEYKGKFDVDYDSNRIIFDDERGLRHIIYYPTGTIIIDELPTEENGE